MSSLRSETMATAAASSTANNAAISLSLAALQTMLENGSKYLSTIDLGHLSVCSKTAYDMAEETLAWKPIFERAALLGAVCTTEFVHPSWQVEHKKTNWMGEIGILECFSKPSLQVLAATGYKRAAMCLRSKTCYFCGMMASNANPLTMTRTCDMCADSDQNSWIMSKSKAKEAFLLSETDCSALRNATIPFANFNPDGTAQTSVLLLISDVMAASFAKYGGADGLAAEFAKRKAKAVSRYEKSQSTDKPQKKRPKIQQLSDHPANDLGSLRYFFGMSNLPIPTVISGHANEPMRMTHATKCKVCKVRGTIRDIVLHERLEHFISTSGDDDAVVPKPCRPFQGVSLSVPVQIQPAGELVQLFANAEIQYECGSKNLSWQGCVAKEFNSKFDFGNNCKVVIDCDMFIGTVIDNNSITIICQTENAAVPMDLAYFAWSNEEYEPFNEAGEKTFEKLKTALGLEATSSSQLLAALISRALPLQGFFASFCHDEPSEEDFPIIHGACTLLKACLETNDG